MSVMLLAHLARDSWLQPVPGAFCYQRSFLTSLFYHCSKSDASEYSVQASEPACAFNRARRFVYVRG